MKKHEAYTLIKEAYHRDSSLSKTDLLRLLAYFAPRVTTPKTAEQWVAQAAAKKDVRPHLLYLYSDGQNLYATDGHRAHYAPTTKPEGFYCPKTFEPRPDVEYKYPDVLRVVPKSPMSSEITHTENTRFGLTQVTATGKHYDDLYVRQAAPLTVREKDDKITGESEFGTYVIMRVRV